MSRIRIIDEYTDLPISRQRKHQLRNREKLREIQRQYMKRKRGVDKSIDIK